LRRSLLLALLAFVVFAGSVPSGFVLDDRAAIETNPIVNGNLPAGAVWSHDFWGTQPPQMGMFRPVATLWFRLDWMLGSGHPFWFHLTNVLLHALVVAVAYRVGRKLLGETPAIIGALFMATFAAPAEAVQGLVGRADLALALFALLGLAAHRTAGSRGALVSALCFALALGSKESAVVVPAVWLLFDQWKPAERSLRTAILRLLACVPVVGLYSLLRAQAVGAWFRPKADPLLSPLGVADSVGRVFGAGRVFLAHYLKGMVDPFDRLYLCTEPACHPSTPSDAIAWLGLFAAGALVAGIVLLARRRSAAALGLAWFALLFLPISNFLVGSTTSYAERLLYAPAIGLGWAMGVGIERLQTRSAFPGLGRALLVLVLVLNALAVQLRHLDWRSDATLFLSGVEASPDDTVVQVNAAHAHFQQGRMEDAAQHAQAALELWPSNVPAASLLGGALDALDRPNEASAVFRQALEGPGREDVALMTEYARFLAHRGQLADAKVWIARAVGRAPSDAEAVEMQRRIEQALIRQATGATP
jgi:Tfp pilus assembly protein PilF